MNAALRAAVVAESHGLPEPNVRPDKWQALEDLPPKLMQRLGRSERLHETEVSEVWKEILAEFIASHSPVQAGVRIRSEALR